MFVEPEGRNTCEIYVNGFSSSLPEDVQFKAMRLIEGFENAKMFRPGYAIEYDFFQPTQLKLSLETRLVKNLFFAGQINGTTGYEEAACQGLMAGTNAHLAVIEEDPFILKRSDAYIGVLIDDLVNKGTDEPYRMFTSRAEYRILLRQDNADLRLTPIAKKLGVINMDERMERVTAKQDAQQEISRFFRKTSIKPSEANGFLASQGSSLLKQGVKMEALLRRPHISMDGLAEAFPTVKEFLSKYDKEFVDQAEVSLKYQGYIAKEQDMVEKMNRLETVRISETFDYHQLGSLSSESREKLSKLQPMTIGQARRISGVSPSDISVLLVHLFNHILFFRNIALIF